MSYSIIIVFVCFFRPTNHSLRKSCCPTQSRNCRKEFGTSCSPEGFQCWRWSEAQAMVRFFADWDSVNNDFMLSSSTIAPWSTSSGTAKRYMLMPQHSSNYLTYLSSQHSHDKQSHSHSWFKAQTSYSYLICIKSIKRWGVPGRQHGGQKSHWNSVALVARPSNWRMGAATGAYLRVVALRISHSHNDNDESIRKVTSSEWSSATIAVESQRSGTRLTDQSGARKNCCCRPDWRDIW